ncbi:hypothetical protein RO3G_08944 [Rhizopus delemar RA 99-880]|uniref:Secreted protein n=1 Tax=Rhizopus delemar (strain RA 99-880 / ATCC MYA-4621 / FGSC 9543 / NRRL 43880) TaxID=246409 RepID=I1C704_RHIO9|nr:hypothetical protein RO3G_08944 [Rhizopus delemar RA 99-880]|eukprot:EIE84234.1 hypothetical protein RO3G_08944 [Rhizopus delemar RA 99-880]
MIFFALLFAIVLVLSAVCAASFFVLAGEETARGVVGALVVPVPVPAALFAVAAGHAVDQVVPVWTDLDDAAHPVNDDQVVPTLFQQQVGYNDDQVVPLWFQQPELPSESDEEDQAVPDFV